MLDLSVKQDIQESTIKFCREKGITLPTFAMMKDPSLVPDQIKETLRSTGLWDLHPANLYRITWKNEPVESGGLFGGVNHMVLPPELTGCRANIIALTGRYFPTGAHKVGATYGCLAPRLATGQFNPLTTKAVWPSTGNYCRGGAYISALLACQAIAILPEGMSQERFDWLKSIAGEVIATPGCESNVKEIFDKCWELRNSARICRSSTNLTRWVTPCGITMSPVRPLRSSWCQYLKPGQHFAGYVSSSGSGGTLGAGIISKSGSPAARSLRPRPCSAPP